MEDTKASDAVCRICFDGDDSGDLVEPCGCSGSQAHVHEKCLQRWRRLQTFQGKHTAATRCEVCGQKYSASLAPPKRPVFALFHEYAHVLLETLWRLLICAITSPFALLSPIIFILVGFPCVLLGIWKGLVVSLAFFPLVVFFLYLNGLKLSVFGSIGHFYIGLSSFGAPVDGLQRGMLLVSIGARGPFEKTVLYVIEHSDTSSLAVILNKPLTCKQIQNKDGGFEVSIRNGGPLRQSRYCIHSVYGVPGAERLVQRESVFLSRDIGSSMDALKTKSPNDVYSMVILQGYASWGSHQLAGEVRRGAWGWIKPEHVQAEDVLEMDPIVLENTWERLINSPRLQVFEG